MTKNFNEYLNEMVSVCKRHFFPGGRYHGLDGHLMFARESLGGALADYDDDRIHKEIGKCYGAYVRCLFGTSNKVLLDSKDLVKEIWSEIHRDRARRMDVKMYLACEEAKRQKEIHENKAEEA